MPDTFIMKQMLPLLHAPICIYSETGEVLQPMEEIEEKKLLEPEDFVKIEWKYPALGHTIIDKKKQYPFPYIHVEENGVAYCVMRSETEGELIGLGKLRIYDFGDEEASHYPYCGKAEFGAVISILWKLVSGMEVGAGTLWAENISTGLSLKEQVTKDIFVFQEEGRQHNPYAQELRELDSIRRGDIAALQRCFDETYSGRAGILANDRVRQYKNIAICTIANATRAAIEGGLNPELAFSMSDTFIRSIEENLTEPIKIEQAVREAELDFAEQVHSLKTPKIDNPLIDQVRDYVFCHIHEPIRVRDVAEAVGVTPNYLSEQFSQCMGVSLKQYIIDEKIISSEQLLKYTDYSLQEISSFCAFSSQSRFSMYFQRKNGITPAKYRKHYNHAENE